MINFTSDFGLVAEQYLKTEYVIWLITLDSNLTPQPRPVWYVWQGDSLLLFSKPNAHKVRHIAHHPKVALHFNTDETGDRRVIVFTGEAAVEAASPPAYAIPAYLEKYEGSILALNMTPESFSAEYSTAIRVKLTDLRGWD